MRLISRNGIIDVPYEISALSTGYGEPDRKYNIYIRSKLLDEKPCVFAAYSNTDKVLKVMEMLRNNSFWVKDVFIFPTDEEVEV